MHSYFIYKFYCTKYVVILNQFKALEAMAEQVKPEGLSIQCANTNSYNALSNKSEKSAPKSRGSSPFKCIGLGLAQQVKYEKVEELSAARLRIEELEAQAACRQKEVDFSFQLHILK